MELQTFTTLLEELQRDIYSFCRYLARDPNLADDLYQETVLQAFANRERIDPNRNPKSLFFAIAIGKWRNLQRKTARRQAIAPSTLLDERLPDTLPGSDPQAYAEKRSMQELLQEKIAALDDHLRIPLILFYFDACPQEEIANIMSLPVGTVKSRLHRGREVLREALSLSLETAADDRAVTYGKGRVDHASS